MCVCAYAFVYMYAHKYAQVLSDMLYLQQRDCNTLGAFWVWGCREVLQQLFPHRQRLIIKSKPAHWSIDMFSCVFTQACISWNSFCHLRCKDSSEIQRLIWDTETHLRYRDSSEIQGRRIYRLFSKISKKAFDAMENPVKRPPSIRRDNLWKTAGPPRAMHTCAHAGVSVSVNTHSPRKEDYAHSPPIVLATHSPRKVMHTCSNICVWYAYVDAAYIYMLYIYIYTYTHHLCGGVLACVFACVCVSVWVSECVCICIYIYTHTHR
jgi:hypothetical protein